MLSLLHWQTDEPEKKCQEKKYRKTVLLKKLQANNFEVDLKIIFFGRKLNGKKKETNDNLVVCSEFV